MEKKKKKKESKLNYIFHDAIILFLIYNILPFHDM